MTWRNSSSRTVLRSAAMLFLPFGGKTSPRGEGPSAMALPLAWWPLLDHVCTVALAKRQITMSQHYQGDVTVKTGPKTPLVVIKAQFSFGVLIKPLNDPADMRKFNQFFQAESVQVPRKIVFMIFFPNVLGNGVLAQEPTSNRQMSATVATSKYLYSGKLLYKRTFGSRPPCHPLPSFRRQLLKDFSGLDGRNAIFKRRSLSGSPAPTVRRSRWIPWILVNQFRITESYRRTHRRNMRYPQSNQTIEQYGLVPVAGIYYHRSKWYLNLNGPVNQVQTYRTFGLKGYRFRHVGFLPSYLVFCPALGQIKASRYRPIKNSINIMGSYKNLAVINPTQCSAVLPADAYGGGALFCKPSVIQDQHPVTDTRVGSHMFGTKLIHLPRVPISTGQKFLQSLSTNFWQRPAEFRGCLSTRARQQAGSVALKTLPALRPAQELAKRGQELCKINQWFYPCLQNSHLPLPEIGPGRGYYKGRENAKITNKVVLGGWQHRGSAGSGSRRVWCMGALCALLRP